MIVYVFAHIQSHFHSLPFAREFVRSFYLNQLHIKVYITHTPLFYSLYFCNTSSNVSVHVFYVYLRHPTFIYMLLNLFAIFLSISRILIFRQNFLIFLTRSIFNGDLLNFFVNLSVYFSYFVVSTGILYFKIVHSA